MAQDLRSTQSPGWTCQRAFSKIWPNQFLTNVYSYSWDWLWHQAMASVDQNSRRKISNLDLKRGFSPCVLSPLSYWGAQCFTQFLSRAKPDYLSWIYTKKMHYSTFLNWCFKIHVIENLLFCFWLIQIISVVFYLCFNSSRIESIYQTCEPNSGKRRNKVKVVRIRQPTLKFDK